jgi:hypothetical protein
LSQSSTKHHIAQFNFGTLVDDWDTPRIAEFQDNLDRVNAIAMRSVGYVWHMDADAMELEQNDQNGPLGANPRLASTLSVWESGKALESFVHKTVHGSFLKRRNKWFEKHNGPSYVIWSTEAGKTPTIKEAVERLEMLGVNGPTKLAFDFDWMRANATQAEV